MFRDDVSMDAMLDAWENEGGSAMRGYTPERTIDNEPHMSQYDALIAWEQGNISEGEAIYLFQGLVDSGLAWRLQGKYGRQAMEFIRAGLVNPSTEAQVDGEGISDFYSMGINHDLYS